MLIINFKKSINFEIIYVSTSNLYDDVCFEWSYIKYLFLVLIYIYKGKKLNRML